jgi:hypothetical protein
MKALMLSAVIAAALTFTGPVEAAPITWCAAEQGQRSQTCAFYTFEQCRAFVFGAGGYCVPNPYLGYYPPELQGYSSDLQERPRPRRRYYNR